MIRFICLITLLNKQTGGERKIGIESNSEKTNNIRSKVILKFNCGKTNNARSKVILCTFALSLSLHVKVHSKQYTNYGSSIIFVDLQNGSAT